MTEASSPSKEFSRIDSFISGGIAGMVTKTIIAPFERVKLIYMASEQRFHYADAIKKLWHIGKTDKIRGLWRGNSMNMIRVFPYTAIVEGINKAIRSIRLAEDAFPRT